MSSLGETGPSSPDEATWVGLRGRVVRGLGWNYAATGLVLIAQVVTTAVTARLVAPHEFGVYAAAQAVFGLAGYFTLRTVGNAFVRDRSDARTTVGTAMIIALSGGAITALGLFFLSGVWASWWHAPGARRLLELYSAVAIVLAASVVPLAILQRGLRFRDVAIAEGGGQLLGTTAGAVFAIRAHSAMALVEGQLLGAVFVFCTSGILTRKDLSLQWSRIDARRLLGFSATVSVQNGMYYTLYTLPAWIIARTFGAVVLGFFSRVSLFVTLPVTHLSTSLTRVLYAVYPRLKSKPANVSGVLVDTVTVVSGVLWPLFAIAAGCSKLIVVLVLGARWSPATSLLGPMCIFACANLAFIVLANCMESLGFLWLAGRIQIIGLLIVGSACAAAVASGFSPSALLMAVAIAHIALHGIQLIALRGRKMIDLRAVARVYAQHGLIAVGAYFLAHEATTLLAARVPVVVGLIAGVMVPVCALSGLRLFAPHLPVWKVLGFRHGRVVPPAVGEVA